MDVSGGISASNGHAPVQTGPEAATDGGGGQTSGVNGVMMEITVRSQSICELP